MTDNKNIEDAKREVNFWWSPKDILSYNCLYNFVIGNRGGGKTYGMKKHTIKNALEKKVTFMYLRRQENEMKDAVQSFFDDITTNDEFPGYEFTTKSGEFLARPIDEEGEPTGRWETIGYYAYLSGARRKKSVSYSTVKIIIFDEFIIPNATPGSYIRDEVTCFLEFYETVARMRDVIVLFLSNAVTTKNPYFLYFGLHRPYNTNMQRVKKDIMIEYVNNPAYTEAKKKTRFGQLVAGTDYEKYAIDNQFVADGSDEEIRPLNENCRHWINYEVGGKVYTLYHNLIEGYAIFSDKGDKTRVEVRLTDKTKAANRFFLSGRAYEAYIMKVYALYLNERIFYTSRRVQGELDSMWKLIA